MNLGEELVSCALRTGTLRPFLAAGITPDWLHSEESWAVFDGEDRETWKYLLGYWDKYRKVPDIGVFRREFPEGTYDLSTSQHTPKELCDLTAEDVQRDIITRAVGQASVLVAQRDTTEAARVLQVMAAKLKGGIGTPRGRSVDLTDPAFDIDALLSREIAPGIPMGIDSIDAEFGGWRPGQVITFLGRQKATKTTSLLHNALTAWKAGWDVLFFSVEMDTTLLCQRVYSLGARISPEKFRRASLLAHQEAAAREFYQELTKEPGSPRFIISEQKAMLSVTDIEAEIELHNPHIVFIDGFGFLRDYATGKSAGVDWQAHENAADQLRALALEKQVPVIVTAQVQEKQHDRRKTGIAGASMQSGGGLLRVSSLVLGFDKDDTGLVNINCVVSRFTPPEDVSLRWDWDHMEMNIMPVTPGAPG
jgi:hypothetical protein